MLGKKNLRLVSCHSIIMGSFSVFASVRGDPIHPPPICLCDPHSYLSLIWSNLNLNCDNNNIFEAPPSRNTACAPPCCQIDPALRRKSVPNPPQMQSRQAQPQTKERRSNFQNYIFKAKWKKKYGPRDGAWLCRNGSFQHQTLHPTLLLLQP